MLFTYDWGLAEHGDSVNGVLLNLFSPNVVAFTKMCFGQLNRG